MLKFKKINSLLFVMVFSIIITSVPMTALAYDYENYSTDSSDTWYGVIDGNSQQQATSKQDEAITAMEHRALYFWRLETSLYGTGSYTNYKPKENASEIPIIYGQRYRGILYDIRNYEQNLGYEGCREHWWASSSAVQEAVETMVDHNCNYAKGTDCSSSACYAWRSAINHNNRESGILMSTNNHINNVYHTAYTCKKIIWDGVDTQTSTQSNIPNRTHYGNYVTRVGQYGQYASTYPLSDRTDTTIGKLNESGNYLIGGTIYNRVYKNMQAGDFLVYRKSKDGAIIAHTMLIKKVVIVYGEDSGEEPDDGDGIDNYKSYVLTDEQTSKMRNCNNAAYNYSYKTTWRLGYNGTGGKKYRFSKLCEYCYLPYRYNGNGATMVSGLIPEQLSETSINVKWHAQDRSFCSGYILKYSTDPSFKACNTVTFNNPTKSEYTIEGLNRNEKYYIKMSAFNTKDGKTSYSGYNNWVSVDLSDGSLYRQNAPDPTKVSQQEYKQYVYDDICIEHEIPDDDIE